MLFLEEKRNLCEGEANLAECIKEVEDAKADSSSQPTGTWITLHRCFNIVSYLDSQ